MASRTAQTESIRAKKRTKAGKKRKTMDRNKGTTPKFEVHEEKKSK